MDAGTAAVLGASVGVIGTLASTWLQHHLQSKRSNALAEKRRQRLRELLMDEQYNWRSMGTLSARIGLNEEATAELLIEMDARTMESDHTKWGLISRNPISQ